MDVRNELDFGSWARRRHACRTTFAARDELTILLRRVRAPRTVRVYRCSLAFIRGLGVAVILNWYLVKSVSPQATSTRMMTVPCQGGDRRGRPAVMAGRFTFA